MLWILLSIAFAGPMEDLVDEVATAATWADGATVVQAQLGDVGNTSEDVLKLSSLLQVATALDGWHTPPHPSVGRPYLEAAISDDASERANALKQALSEAPIDPTNTDTAESEAATANNTASQEPLGPEPPPDPAMVRKYLDNRLTRQPITIVSISEHSATTSASSAIYLGGTTPLSVYDFAKKTGDRKAVAKMDRSRRVSLPIGTLLLLGGCGVFIAGAMDGISEEQEATRFIAGGSMMLGSAVPYTALLWQHSYAAHWTNGQINSRISRYNARLASKYKLTEQQALDAETGR